MNDPQDTQAEKEASKYVLDTFGQWNEPAFGAYQAGWDAALKMALDFLRLKFGIEEKDAE